MRHVLLLVVASLLLNCQRPADKPPICSVRLNIDQLTAENARYNATSDFAQGKRAYMGLLGPGLAVPGNVPESAYACAIEGTTDAFTPENRPFQAAAFIYAETYNRTMLALVKKSRKM